MKRSRFFPHHSRYAVSPQGAFLNLETYTRPKSNDASAAILAQRQTISSIATHISRYEFERLLQRAMEIMNARDLAEQIMASLRPDA